MDNDVISVSGETGMNTDDSGNAGNPQPPSGQGGPKDPNGGKNAPKVKNAPKDVKVQVNSEPCSNFGIEQCSQSRAACDAAAGGSNYQPPTITWIKIDNGPWTY